MAQGIRSYKDLTTWQIARSLCLEIYDITNSFPKSERYSLSSQMQRAAISIPSNIAEGFGRQTAKEKQLFYHHSLGSLFELETQADIAHELKYVEDDVYRRIELKIDSCRRLLLALLNANRANIPIPNSQISNLKSKKQLIGGVHGIRCNGS